jgi:CubicO group peptidase (beta-lactamase class C family)
MVWMAPVPGVTMHHIEYCYRLGYTLAFRMIGVTFMNKINCAFVYFAILFQITVTNASAQDVEVPHLDKRIQEQLETIEQRFGVVGQSVRILKNGELLFDGRQGFANLQLNSPLTEKNKFPVYSISKLFTNVLLMKLVEDGKLDLEKSIRHYLPTLPQSWQNVTVSHVWNHMSGLPEFFSVDFIETSEISDRLELLETVRDNPFEYETGTRTRYNQTGFTVLSAILEKLYGKPHPQLVKEIIFDPLDLSNSGYAGSREIIDQMVSSYRPQDGVLMAAQDLNWPTYSFSFSALYSTPDDLTKFMNAVYDEYFVNKATLELLWQPMARTNGQPGGYAQGWNWGKSGPFNYVGHTGGNNTKLRQYYTDTNDGTTYTIAYLTNGSRTNIYVDHLVDEVMALVDPEAFVLEKLGVDLSELAFSSPTASQLDTLIANYKANGGDVGNGLNDFINQKAYVLLFSAGADGALPLFELNTRLYPKSANSWDSLAEAWLVKGERELAIKYYEIALGLDPNLQSALQQLESLKE